MTKRKIAAAFAAFLFWTASCSPKLIPTQTETIYRDTTIIRETKIPVVIEGTKVEVQKLNLDSLLQIAKNSLNREKPGTTITKTDPKTGQQLQLIIDQFGNLTAICETQERTIEVLNREVERLRTEITRITTEKKKGFFEKVKDQLAEIALILVLIIVALFFIFRRFK